MKNIKSKIQKEIMHKNKLLNLIKIIKGQKALQYIIKI